MNRALVTSIPAATLTPTTPNVPWYRRERTERERLLSALHLADRHGWHLTYLHMANKLVDYDAGRITQLFPV